MEREPCELNGPRALDVLQTRARDMGMRRGRVHAAGRRPHLSSAPLLRCTTGDDGAEGILLRGSWIAGAV